MSSETTQNYPYVSASSFKTFLDLLRRKNFKELSVKTLEDNGFSNYVSSAMVSTSKMLGLINEENVALEKLKAITASTTDEDLKKVLNQIVHDTYGSIIEGVDLSRADLKQIEGIFRRRDLSPSVAEKASRFFVWIAKEAGLDVGAGINLYSTTNTKSNSNKATKPKNEIKKDTKKEEIIDTQISNDLSANDYQKLLIKTVLENIKKSGSIDAETIRLTKEMIDDLKKLENPENEDK